MTSPDSYDRVANVIIRVVLRMLRDDEGPKGGYVVDSGVLPGVNRRASGRELWMEGQADGVRAYSVARDLGPVTVVEDAGLSGKDMMKPGAAGTDLGDGRAGARLSGDRLAS